MASYVKFLIIIYQYVGGDHDEILQTFCGGFTRKYWQNLTLIIILSKMQGDIYVMSMQEDVLLIIKNGKGKSKRCNQEEDACY